MPELGRLRAFVAVAREQSFTAAAHGLHLSQQAVSRSVAALERELGVQLLERSTRRVQLTERGAKLLTDLAPLLASMDAVLVAARAGPGHAAGPVRVAHTPSLGVEEVNSVVAALRETRYPPRVTVGLLRPRAMARALADGGVDLGLVRTVPSGHRGSSRLVTELPVGVALALDHRLARRGQLRWGELDGERLLVWNPPGSSYTDLLLGMAVEHGARLSPVQGAIVGGQGLAEVAQGRGLALVPTTRQAPPGVRVVPLDGGTLPIRAMWIHDLAPPPVHALIDRLATGPLPVPT